MTVTFSSSIVAGSRAFTMGGELTFTSSDYSLHFIYRHECHKYIYDCDEETVKAYSSMTTATSEFAEAQLNGRVQLLD
jgi:hypothetical protein